MRSVRRFSVYHSVQFFLLFTTLSALTSCAGNSDPAQQAQALHSLQPILSAAQVAEVHSTFPNFSPELFDPSINPMDANSLVPATFSPAYFFGPATAGTYSRTTLGLNLNLNGFDSPNQPMYLPSNGIYFDRQGNSFPISLGPFTLVPLNDLEARLNVPLSPNAPVLNLDRRRARIDPAEIDQIMLTVRNSVATKLPAVMGVNFDSCDITIEPAIFYVSATNFGNIWAGGTTERLGNGRYRIRVEVFYINGQQRIADWREFLVHEAINFFVLSVGRDDLAR